ncbi:MAG: TIGR03087 family PEP-CTERM/XrtA system glycosyltransferase, partial [Planctomycetota bacterium]
MERLLYISHRLPYPPDKGERVRAFHEIKLLAERYELTLASLVHDRAELDHVSALEAICHEVITAPAGGKLGLLRGAGRFLVGRSVTEGYFHNPVLMKRLHRLSEDQPFDVVFGYCSSTLPYVRAVRSGRRVLDLVDVDSLKWEAYAAAARGPKRWLYAAEARRVAALERRAVETCDAVLLVSQAELDAFRANANNVHAVGNGVDTEYFRPDAVEPMDLGPKAVVFTGTMSYAPNAEGVLWFVREVWPAVRKAHPRATFTIVGRDPTPAVRKLADTPGVTVTGSVPDVRPYLTGAKLAVCPLLTARGIQNKILEALAMGLPVVATPAAAEGLGRTPGEPPLVADLPGEWRDRLSALLCDEPALNRMSAAGRAHIEQHHTWRQQLGRLLDTCPG